MIEFRCPTCDRRIGVPESRAGGTTVCPGCASKLRVPGEAPVEEAAHSPPRPTSRRRPQAELHYNPNDEFEIVDEAPARRPRRRDEQEEVFDEPRDDEEEEIFEDRPRKKRRRRPPEARENFREPPPRSRDDDEEEIFEDRPRKKRRRRRRSHDSDSILLGMDAYLLSLAGIGLLSMMCLFGALIIPPIAFLPMFLGFVMTAVGGIWIIVIAFQEDGACGLMCIFVPFYMLYYIVSRLDETLRPFCLYLLGIVLQFISIFVAGGLSFIFLRQMHGAPF